MKITTELFGELTVEEESIIEFKEGLLAFEDLKRFILVDVKENHFLKWLQSVDDSSLYFLLVDPFIIKPDYSIELSDSLQEELEIEKEEDVLVFSIVTMPKSGFKDATANLLGPVVINHRSKKGKQVVTDGDETNLKYPLSPETPKKASSGG